MDWTTDRLTEREAERALRAAGIDPDSSTWSPADACAAYVALKDAQNAKSCGTRCLPSIPRSRRSARGRTSTASGGAVGPESPNRALILAALRYATH